MRALAREILARDEFARHRAPPDALERLFARLEEARQALLDWLPDWVKDLWDGVVDFVTPDLDGSSPFAWLAALVTLVAIAALATIAVGVLNESARDRDRPGARPRPGRGPSLESEARRLAAAGHFLDAAHAVQLAVLELMLDRRLLELGRSDPNRTLRRRLREAALPDRERADFLSLLDRLESRWFRDRVERAEQDRELYDAWRALHGRIESLGAAP